MEVHDALYRAGLASGRLVIVPHRQPPFPAIFATRAQALTYADALAATPLV
jgi:hypothetical protein